MDEKKKKKYEALEKEINETIEKMKEKDIKVNPGDSYKKIIKEENNAGGSPKERVKTSLKPREGESWVLYTILFLLGGMMLLLAFGVLFGDSKPIESSMSEDIVPKSNYQIINEIEFKVTEISYKDSSLKIKIVVRNRGEHNFYTTVRSMYLVDEKDKEYYPNISEGKIPTILFGGKMPPKTESSAELVFNDVPENYNKTTLVINNVSDAYHYIWDYMITLPKE